MKLVENEGKRKLRTRGKRDSKKKKCQREKGRVYRKKK